MKKTILALAAIAAIAVSTLSPTPADARWRGGVGLGILGGVVAGTIIGSAIASHPGYYALRIRRPRAGRLRRLLGPPADVRR